MKRFFEEYGGIALAILVVLVLIAILSPVGGKIKGSLKEVTKGFDDKMKNGMNSSGIGFGGSSGGSGTKPEQTVNLTTGQKITIAGKEYTVIECNGTQCKVLATDTFKKAFDDNDSNNYASSTIATYLNGDYYNSLDPKIQNAIVETTIQQKVSSTGYDGGKNSPTWTGETKDTGIHKVFLPSWDELTKAAGGTDPTTLKTFLNSKYVWLRDTYSSFVLFVVSNGNLSYDPPDLYGLHVRPAFVLDLSKVEYTTK